MRLHDEMEKPESIKRPDVDKGVIPGTFDLLRCGSLNFVHDPAAVSRFTTKRISRGASNVAQCSSHSADVMNDCSFANSQAVTGQAVDLRNQSS